MNIEQNPRPMPVAARSPGADRGPHNIWHHGLEGIMSEPQEENPPAKPAAEAPPRPDPGAYWRANLRVIAALLAVWFVVSFGFGILLVEPLNRLRDDGIGGDRVRLELLPVEPGPFGPVHREPGSRPGITKPKKKNIDGESLREALRELING